MTLAALYGVINHIACTQTVWGDNIVTIDEINIPQATSTEFQLTCENTGLSYDLDGEVLIGRELDCSIRLASPQIRSYHAKISKSDDGIFLEDLNAKNNTSLNGSRIGTGAWVTLGDEINFDGVFFVIETKEESASSKLYKEAKAEAEESASNTASAFSPTEIKESIDTKKAESKDPGNPMPFSNQDVVEATRALEERAKARLQLYKKNEDSGLHPDWESFIAKRNKSASKKRDAATASTPTTGTSNTNTSTTGASTTSTSTISTTIVRTQKDKSAETATNAPESGKAPKAELQPKPRNKAHTTKTRKEIPPNQLSEPEAAPTKPLDDFDAANDCLSSEEQAELLEMIDDLDTPQAEPSTAKLTVPIKDTGNGPRLIVQSAPTRGKTYHLAPTDAKKSWTIGRAENADIQITENTIDRIHAHIEETESGFKVRTTRATNGMLINDKLKAEANLTQGDIVQFGRISFEYREDKLSAASQEDNQSGKITINYSTLIAPLVILSALLVALLVAPK